MCHDPDDRWLAQTLELARQGAGTVEPNPRVGAAIVKAGAVVATGFHREYGGLHAEAAALEAAGVGHDGRGERHGRDAGAVSAAAERVRGATLYCNLEPCSYRSPEKHQPPCTEAIIAAGIRRVVIGQHDPNPAVRGRGVMALRDAGIVVDCAGDPGPFLLENDRFNTIMALGRPFVHLKAAISLDGRLATAGGDSKWITDEGARASAHEARAGVDAVMVGRGTVSADDPLLTARVAPAGAVQRQPRPVVLDTGAAIRPDSRLVRDRGGELILCVGPDAPAEKVRALEDRRVTVVNLGDRGTGASTLDPAAILDALWERNIRSVLVEGGARVLTAFLRARLFDRISFYVAPILLGRGREAVEDLSIQAVADAVRFESVRWKRIGDQQLFTGMRAGWQDEVRAAAALVGNSPGGKSCLPA